MARDTHFLVECHGQQHRITVSTEMLPDPATPGAVYPHYVMDHRGLKIGSDAPYTRIKGHVPIPGLIPCPHVTFLDHCACPEPENCDGSCSGQSDFLAELVAIKMSNSAIPCCAQWFLEFAGSAPNRVDRKWWELIQHAKVPA